MPTAIEQTLQALLIQALGIKIGRRALELLSRCKQTGHYGIFPLESTTALKLTPQGAGILRE